MPRTLVSVIIPAFNAAHDLERSVVSVLEQTHTEVEVLIVDDGSTDATAAVAARLANDDGRVRVFSFAQNRGPAAARNAGLSAAQGAWVSLLDADDAMRPERLSALLDVATAHGADMVSDNLLLVGGEEAGVPMLSQSMLPRPVAISLNDFISRNASASREARVNYGFMKPMIRSSFLREHGIRYDEGLRFAEDFTMYVRCLAQQAVWWITPEPMYLYTVRANSLTQQQSSSDLKRLADNDRLLRAEAVRAGDPQLARAISRHLKIIDRDYAYRAFTDAVKARRPGVALRVLAERWSYPWLVLIEACRQAPIVARKAISGGYR